MKMVIESTVYDERNDGAVVMASYVEMGESGWKSVKEFQRARLKAYKDHPREEAKAIEDGIEVRDRQTFLGMREVQKVRLVP